MNLRPFTKTDWYCYSGAVPLPDGSAPYISRPVPTDAEDPEWADKADTATAFISGREDGGKGFPVSVAVEISNADGETVEIWGRYLPTLAAALRLFSFLPAGEYLRREDLYLLSLERFRIL